jgi:hypothetical protein
MRKMTNKQYVKFGGDKCPSCKKTSAMSMDHIIDTIGTAYRNMICGECDIRWTEYYKLVGYNDLHYIKDFTS